MFAFDKIPLYLRRSIQAGILLSVGIHAIQVPCAMDTPNCTGKEKMGELSVTHQPTTTPSKALMILREGAQKQLSYSDKFWRFSRANIPLYRCAFLAIPSIVWGIHTDHRSIDNKSLKDERFGVSAIAFGTMVIIRSQTSHLFLNNVFIGAAIGTLIPSTMRLLEHLRKNKVIDE